MKASITNTSKHTHSIRCSSCSAPIEMIGNQLRLKVLVCSYCNTVMDCKDEFRALYSYTHIEKPSSHLRIGMRANIKGIDFTISAFVIYESLQGAEEEWIEYQLYASKYGYAYIIIRGEKCCFLRKTYCIPKPNIWLLNKGEPFTAKQKKYVIEEFYLSRVLHCEGALLENIEQDKRDKHCFASNNDNCYYSKYKVGKLTYYQGIYMNKEQLKLLFT